MSEALPFLVLPFLACLVLTGIHGYLGIHIVAREVIFVDLTLAQVAALGAAVAFLFGYNLHSTPAYFISLGFTWVGAAVLALTRARERRVSQEAIIGIVYAVSAAAAVLVLDRAPHGGEQIRHTLVGNLLAVTGTQIWKTAFLYAIIGAFHYWARGIFALISVDPEEAYRRGLRVRWWDFIFYASFGLVVTSSVEIAGVILVFAFLIVPAVCATYFADRLWTRLVIGWALGFAVSVLGIYVSYAADLPTGATVVCTFGLAVLICGPLSLWLRRTGLLRAPEQRLRLSPVLTPANPAPETGR
jgi:zinc/manganese transport system permease protein